MQLTPRRLLLALAAALGSTACLSSPGQEHNHWNVESVNPRLAYHFLGWREDLDGSYRQFQWEQKQGINLTMRRHFLNNNPFNPFQAHDPGVVAPRPAHSILPDPIAYMHLESITTGFILLAWTGVFVPIPIGSVIASLTPGGGSEFVQGIGNAFTGSWGARLDEPPEVSEFRVRNSGVLR